MPSQTATVIVTAPVPRVYDFLADPRNLSHYLPGIVAGLASSFPGTASSGTRWSFYADPATHRLSWALLSPLRAEGDLQVFGDCSVSQLWLRVRNAPPHWSPDRIRTLMRAVLHQIQEQIEDAPTPTDHGELARSA